MKTLQNILIGVLLIGALLVPSSVQTWGPMGMSGGVATGAWYYSGDGTWEDTNHAYTGAYGRAGVIPTYPSGNVTKISIYITTKDSATEGHIALYSDVNEDGGTLISANNITFTPADGQWNDITLASPVAVTTGGYLKVWFETNSDFHGQHDSGTNGRYSARTYGTAWPSTLSGSSLGSINPAVRVFIQ